MSLATESVTLAGSGLVFINYYDPSVTDAYRSAILGAENFLQSHFTNSVTVNIDFGLQALSGNFTAQNSFDQVNVSYAQLAGALASHAVTADDQLSVAGLPQADPSHGAGFAIPIAEAVVLGLAPQTNADNDSVVLSSRVPFTFGQDAIGVLEHEITEGVFGRTSSLGFNASGGRFQALDLFRFTAAGARDYTGGSDGVATFFGIDPAHVTSLQYHSAINAQGMNDGFDLGDWDHTFGDAFGPGGPSDPGTVRATDLRVLDVLGWTPTSSGELFVPAPDEFASSLGDTAHPFGTVVIGGSASGALQQAGDHDWFQVTFQAGATYTITETGQAGGGGSLGDPFLQLHDAAGTVLASNDDIVSGANPDSRIVFTAPTTGTYYIDAGAFADGYAGSYRIDVSQTSGAAAPGMGEVLNATATNTQVFGGSGDDTITGASVDDYLRGGLGDDVIFGGSAFNDMNGNQGNDTIHGGSGDNWVVGGQGDDLLFGGGGTNQVLGNLGNDTLHAGAGGDIVRGGKGDDVIFGGPGADFLSGDLGDNTLTGGTGPDTFHSFGAVGLDLVTNFNEAKGDRVQLDPGTTYAVSQVGADTEIDMTGGGRMVLQGVSMASLHPGWIFVG